MSMPYLLMKYHFRALLVVIGLGTASGITSCSQRVSLTSVQPTKEVPQTEQGFSLTHARMPSDSSDIIYSSLKHPKSVYRFYLSRSFDKAWLSDSTNARMDSLLSFIKAVRFHGLLPQDYHFAEFERPEGDTSYFYRKEALLTDAFLSLARDLKFGRLFSRKNPDNDSLNFVVLENALAHNEVKKVLISKEPRHSGYRDLKKSLFELLTTADSSNFALLHAGITIDSLDLHKKVQRIEINMERWRTELPDLEQRYIWINIPSFQLQVIDHEQTVLEARIIVGKAESPTPELSSVVECITLFPYWYIPRKIAIAEYLPEIQKDTSFLAKNNFDVLDRNGDVLDPATVDWQRYSEKYFPVSLRQREGPDNSLGVIKFIFDNPYAVFLHDTNAKNLFRKKTRMFSHGCIRMEKAVELANYLTHDPQVIEEKLSLKQRYTINLSDPIPIYVRYFTCESKRGELNFYDDVYGLDQPIIDFLYHPKTD